MPLQLLRYRDAVHVCRGLGGALALPEDRVQLLKELKYFEGVEGEWLSDRGV